MQRVAGPAVAKCGYNGDCVYDRRIGVDLWHSVSEVLVLEWKIPGPDYDTILPVKAFQPQVHIASNVLTANEESIPLL